MSSRPPRRLVTLYRWTTALLPASQREKYADEQVQLFEEVWREERPCGRIARAAWIAGLLGRSVLAAAGARLDRRRRPAASTHADGASAGFLTGNDLRFTVRSLRASFWYAAAAMGVIAVTTALATTTFAIVDGVLFRPLPYPDADRLVAVQPGFRDAGPPTSAETIFSTSRIDLANWHAAAPDVAFTGFSVGRYAETGAGVGINEDTAGVAEVLPDFFTVIGVRPLFGGFSAGDFEQPSGYRPVILMYDTWQGRFGGDPNVLGKVEILIRPRDFGFGIVGVMPRGFTFPSARVSVDFIAPMAPGPPASTTDPRVRSVREVVARLPPGMQPEELRERLAPGLAASADVYESLGARAGFDPRTDRPYDTVGVMPLSQALAQRSGGLFMGVVAAAGLLLVLTAVNLSSLMTSRAIERRRELDVRRALGASRNAIIRLWTTEAALLLGAGALVGILAAAALLPHVVSLLPESVVLLKPARLDWRVAGFVIGTTGLLVAAISVAPVRSSLRPAGAGPSKGGSSERLRTTGHFVVVSGQIAAAFVLTTVGVCLVGSLLVVYGQDLPIRTDGVIVLESRLHGPGGGRTPAEQIERVARGRLIRERLAAIPGVASVGLVEAEVLRGGGRNLFSRPNGVAPLPDLDTWGVSGAFYRTVEPVVSAGRLPTERELEAGDPLIVVSERVARAYWPGAGAIGQTLTDARHKVPHTVIGVVRDVRWSGWDLESPMIYGPYSRLTSSPFQTFFIRTEIDTAATIRQAVGAVTEIDPTVRPRTAATLEEMYRASVAMRRFQSWLFGGFATAALVVVGVGILGLLAMSAARRTKEIGIRCALGATPRSVISLMVREQLAAICAGLLVGGVAAAWAVGLVQGYLYQLSVSDPRIWGAAIATIVFTAGVGTLAPALRASRVDPLQALRAE